MAYLAQVIVNFEHLNKISNFSFLQVITSPNEGLSSPPTGSCGPGSTRSGGGMSPCYSNHSSSGGGNSSSTPIGGCTASPSCCENGRPLVTDPMTGQSVVCSCQYDSAARLAALSTCAAYPRLATTASGVYGTPYPSTDQNPYPSIDSSPFYSSLVSFNITTVVVISLFLQDERKIRENAIFRTALLS